MLDIFAKGYTIDDITYWGIGLANQQIMRLDFNKIFSIQGDELGTN
jgi:hypothetical protein